MPTRNTLILILVAAALGGYIFWENSKPAPTPQTTETGTPQPLVTVSVPTLSGPAVLGETIFNAKCAACHGANAAGQDGIGPPLIHKIYEPSHHGDASFLAAAQFGVRAHHWPFGDMPPMEGITQGEVKILIAYIRALQKENGIF